MRRSKLNWGLATWRYPGPPKRYDAEELDRFFDRENARIKAGKITWTEWNRLSYEKRCRIPDPERVYWKHRLNNESRRGQRRAARHRRLDQMRKGDVRDAEAFYQEVRASALVTCAYCESQIRGRDAHIDHVVPLCRGGEHRRANLVAACEPCNRRKGTLTSDEFRARRAAKAPPRRTQRVRETKKPRTAVYAAAPTGGPTDGK